MVECIYIVIGCIPHTNDISALSLKKNKAFQQSIFEITTERDLVVIFLTGINNEDKPIHRDFISWKS